MLLLSSVVCVTKYFSTILAMRFRSNTYTYQRFPHLGTLPSSYAEWDSLVMLDVSSNKLVGTLPPQFGNLSSNFSFLSLRNNTLSGTLPSEWSKLQDLNQLYLDTNRLSGKIPPSWGNSATMQHRQVLTLQTNYLTGSIPPGVANGPQVRESDLERDEREIAFVCACMGAMCAKLYVSLH